jgi:hypothetical protein
MPHEKPDDLDWLAFCYIADELSRDEVDAFEARLADDQQAREAVARAVELTRAIAVAGAGSRKRTEPASRVAGAWRRLGLAGRIGRLAWAAAAAAACLAAVLAYQHYRSNTPMAGPPQEVPGAGEIETPGSRPRELALLWSRTREELAALQLDGWAADLPGEGEAPDEQAPFPAEDQVPGEDQLDEDPLAANVPPSWMLAAVRAGSGGPGAEDYGNSDPEEN